MSVTMEGTAVAGFFASAVSEEEWKTIPSEIAKKIEVLTEEKFEELITSKALSETAKFNAEKTLTDIQTEFDTIKIENEQFKLKLEAATSTITELESQLSNTVAETTKLRETCNRLEQEVADFRHQRNLAVDERDELSKMLERRDGEIERTQSDLLTVTKQLDVAVAAKCEALAKSEEVAAMKMTLEYKEKRIEQERSLIMQQMDNFAEELRNKTDELLNMRRDNTTRCFQLETKLSEKVQELKLATDTVKSVTDTNNNLITKIEEMNKKHLEEKEVSLKTQEAYQHEMDAQKKLANLYKEMSQEKAELSEKLTQGYQEVKEKLDEAIEKYGDLETKHKETCLAHEEIISKKTECITMLKKELVAAQDLIENLKTDSFQKEVEGLSPSAAVTSKFIKSGMTMTQIYSEYMTATEQLATYKEEVVRLQTYVNQILQEIEEKSPYLAKQRDEYEKAMESITELTKHNDDLINDMQVMRDACTEAKRLEGITRRENQRLKKELQDLGRQVCHLLREVEQSRAGSSTTSTDQDLSDSISSADIISKRLVTFSDLSELQANNQRLLALVRELSSKQEEVEELDVAEVAKLKSKLESMREQHADLLEQQEKQAKMMNMLINQRDMYKNLYSQVMKGAGEDITTLDNSFRENASGSPKGESENQTEDKVRDLEMKIENLQKEVNHAKEEYEIYKKEKIANEKILLEQMEKCRSDMNEMVCKNAKLTTKMESSDEMFKVLKNNTSIYKNQIEKLEERTKIYAETIAKHETSLKYLRDETIDAQSKLARAEVLVGNLQKENALLRDSETRLLKERESLKKESYAQNLMHTNIELIKATLERNDAESKMRLEEQMQEAHRECAALRRRLQEEQDRFRQLTDHLEKQTQNAQARMEEEKSQADKLRNELVGIREDLTAKSMQVEDLSKKLKTSLFTVGADSSADSKKYRELENMLNEREVEIEGLQQKLKTAKEAIEQHTNVAECAEKQLIEVSEQNKKYKEMVEKKIKDQDQRIKQLEEQCSELQGELSVYNDGQESAMLERAQIQTAKELADVKRELEATRSEIKVLQENLESAENKYAHEMMLHSNDLKNLTVVKEELAKAIEEIEGVKSARDKANIILEESKQCWAKQEELFTKEKEELEKRFKDLDAQNSLLLGQLQELNTQLSIVQAQASDPNTSQGDTSFNKSLTEDDIKSSDQLLKIIKYLRQEKDIAVSKCEILEAEHARVKSQFDVIGKQLEEAKSALEVERQKSDVSFVTAAKHAEVLRKVETLNAITDSNRSLRTERDLLLSQVNELRARTLSLEEQLAPLQEKNREITIKAEAMQTENVTLRGEATRWRQRANMLIEKSNRTSPEDWKKLQNERESLAKQLMVERSNNTQLNAEVNNLTKEKAKLDEQLKEIRKQLAQQKDDLDRVNSEVSSLRSQVTALTNDLNQTRTEHGKLTEDHKTLTDDAVGKEAMIVDLKNNLVQIRKIAKKYKTQCEEQSKELETLKQRLQEAKEEEIPAEKQEQLRQEGRLEIEERLNQQDQTHQLKLAEITQQMTTANEENETYKKEIENLKQTSLEKEERFKTLFKNAKDRIMTLTEQNSSLKAEVNSQERQGKSSTDVDKEKDEEIEKLKKEKDDIQTEKQTEKEKLTQEIETLTQRVNQLQRQLGQQGSKPSTSSGPTEKSTTEPPTANIKPMSGHSTTQTQSVTIPPWRSGGEPPLASIRPMSMQLRTVAALRTGQSPSVMVPPQQVHTTGTTNIEALSSSPTSSHTDYAPATSSAPSAMLGPRQVAVPPTQSSQDAEDEESSMQVQPAPQQQAVALVLPRVEPPNSGPTQEQGTSSSSSSNTVTTTQAGHKRPREADTDSCQSDENTKQQQQPKRTRVQGATETFQSVSESGLEVEYQVPTSSQRDHEEDTEAVIVVESDEEGDGPDEGEGADDDPDDPDTESYDMEGTYGEQMNFEDAECQDVEEDEGGNEVEVIEDSSEVPNQSERQEAGAPEESAEQAQSEATSSGADGGGSCGVTVSQASTSVSVTMPSSRTRPVAPLSRQQQTHLLLPEEGGDDGIVPSTPTLFVPRRSDGFGEAVSSPNVPTSGRFTFSESGTPNNTSNEVIPEQTLEANLDDDSTGRSVPSTPLQASPQEAGPSGEEQSSHQTLHTDGEIPSIAVSGVSDETEQAPEGSTVECMGPPSVAGTSTENQTGEQSEEMLEGEDGVSSEGEKSLASKEGGGEEEGREAEASPSTNTRSKTATPRGSNNSGRRSMRHHMRGNDTRSGPTPIIWGEHRDNRDGNPRMRGQPGNYSPRVARRSRARIQRPYGGGNRF